MRDTEDYINLREEAVKNLSYSGYIPKVNGNKVIIYAWKEKVAMLTLKRGFPMAFIYKLGPIVDVKVEPKIEGWIQGQRVRNCKEILDGNWKIVEI
ncbi:MAG: hypothetical protein ABIB79_01990 [archaeon]